MRHAPLVSPRKRRAVSGGFMASQQVKEAGGPSEAAAEGAGEAPERPPAGAGALPASRLRGGAGIS